jgi:predicted dehydrogenase
MDRRDFFRRAGVGAAVVGMGLASESAFAKQALRKTDPHAPKTGSLLKPDEVIGIGMIGVGGMGSGHVGELLDREKGGEKQQIRAICDCYVKRQNGNKNRVKEVVGRDVETCFDYKKLLERDDIHAVVIATPDHWHAQISIDAMNAGKDVYCQKPVTLTIPESLEVRDTSYATGRVFQCGSQRCSQDFFWQARKFIEKGGIGKVLWAQGDYSRNSAGGPNDRGGEWNWPIDPGASPDKSSGENYIDWERWLGPAKKRPFSKARFFQFRKYWDYSGGIATDLLYHLIAPLTIALGVSAPEKGSAAGGIFVQHDDREVPDTFMVTLDYPEDVTLVLTSSMANRQGNPIVIRGHKATIRQHEEGMQVTAENEFKDWFTKEFGAPEIIVKNEQRDDHMTNFLKACRERGATHCDPETAYRAMAATRMGCDSWRQDKVIFWDNAKEKYVNKHPRPNRTSRWPQEPEPTAT